MRMLPAALMLAGCARPLATQPVRTPADLASGAFINETLKDPIRKLIGFDTTSIELAAMGIPRQHQAQGLQRHEKQDRLLWQMFLEEYCQQLQLSRAARQSVGCTR